MITQTFGIGGDYALLLNAVAVHPNGTATDDYTYEGISNTTNTSIVNLPVDTNGHSITINLNGYCYNSTYVSNNIVYSGNYELTICNSCFVQLTNKNSTSRSFITVVGGSGKINVFKNIFDMGGFRCVAFGYVSGTSEIDFYLNKIINGKSVDGIDGFTRSAGSGVCKITNNISYNVNYGVYGTTPSDLVQNNYFYGEVEAINGSYTDNLNNVTNDLSGSTGRQSKAPATCFTDAASADFTPLPAGDLLNSLYVAPIITGHTTYLGGLIISADNNYAGVYGYAPLVILTYPTDTDTDIETNPVFSWGLAVDAITYNLQVSTVSNFATTVIDESGIATNSYSSSGLDNEQLYYWRVRYTYTGGTSDWSTVFSFTTETGVVLPETPINIKANDGDEQIEISWDSSIGATSYNIYFKTTAGVTTGDTKLTGVTSPYEHTGLTNGQTLYYKVEAENEFGVSPLSVEVSATPNELISYAQFYASSSMMADKSSMMANSLRSVGDVSELCDIDGQDHNVVMTGVRLITSTVGNYVKVDYINGSDETETVTIQLREGKKWLRNITKVYDKAESDTNLENVYVWR